MLITSLQDSSADEVVSHYKLLADIERGFQVLKSQIEIAPVYHRLPERIRAHALICFLALVLHRILRQGLKAAGSSESPDRALQMLRRIQHHTARISGHRYSGTTRLNPKQLDLFKLLDIPAPGSPK
ncbi:MAG: IS1634 family transposase [Methylococcales bacterium]